ncbi:hypothetical protein AAZX31_18G081600 [Glycine max]
MKGLNCCNSLFPQPPSHVSLSDCQISPPHLIPLNSRTLFSLFHFSCIRPDSSPPLSSLSFPFCDCSFLLLPLFFLYSHLNYNGRGRVFPLQEKVEEHIKAAIFISKNPRVQRRWKNTLKLRFLSQKIQEYRKGGKTH